MNATPPHDAATSSFQDELLALPMFADVDVDFIGFGGGSGDATDGGIGTLLRLHLDPTLLATFESPNFDEVTAVPLDALVASQSPASKPSKHAKTVPTQAAPTTPKSTHDVVKKEPVNDAAGEDASVGLMLSTLRTPTGDMRCRYRKDKCSSARTLKKNGSLHSYCEIHRQRSIVNQRRFDSKKRAERQRWAMKCPCGPSPFTSKSLSQLLPRAQQRDRPSDDASPSVGVSTTKHTAQTTESSFAWV